MAVKQHEKALSASSSKIKILIVKRLTEATTLVVECFRAFIS